MILCLYLVTTTDPCAACQGFPRCWIKHLSFHGNIAQAHSEAAFHLPDVNVRINTGNMNTNGKLQFIYLEKLYRNLYP